MRPVLIGVPGFRLRIVLNGHVRDQLPSVIIDTVELVAKPEVDHVGEIDGLEIIDVDVLALVQD